MKKLLIILTALLIAFPLVAQNAVVKETSGRVEIQSPGGSWQAASSGAELPKGATISTGFGSSAVIEAGASTLTVDAMSRIKLEELMENQGTQTTGVFLRVGKVKAEVKRDRDLSHDFRLRSPSSTAAVRGTSFTFDGQSVEVSEGVVAMVSSALGREVLVAGGESCKVAASGKTSDPVTEKVQESTTDADVNKEESSTAQSGASQSVGATATTSGGSSQKTELYGDISITIK